MIKIIQHQNNGHSTKQLTQTKSKMAHSLFSILLKMTSFL